MRKKSSGKMQFPPLTWNYLSSRKLDFEVEHRDALLLVCLHSTLSDSDAKCEDANAAAEKHD